MELQAESNFPEVKHRLERKVIFGKLINIKTLGSTAAKEKCY